jgi:hypothetical protein
MTVTVFAINAKQKLPTPSRRRTRMMNDKDRDEARKEAFEFVEIIYKGIANNLDYSPTWKVLERDARIRADERRRCAILAMIYADNHGQEIAEGNLRGLYTAVLQGTEPAKVSEAVERDILTIDRVIRYPEHFPGLAIEASAALDRLVERIKELENNG